MMEHKGNICNINGAEVEPVDVVIGGSPCQDLSVAGKRAGLDGERSGLFMEQIRIIKEMRDATNGTCPRYMVWENVPGAFSSNKGEDFRVVLEETAKIADEAAIIPRPDQGEWTNSGAIMGNGWSIAWRVFDAQFWGVPQRRRRIALVADFGGRSAPEILFERQSVSGNPAESGTEGQGVAGDAERRTRTAGGSDVTSTLFAAYGTKWNGNSGALTGDHFVLDDTSLSSNSMKSSNPHSGCRQVEIAKCIDTTNPDPSKNQGGMAVLFEPRSQDGVPRIHDKICPTLNTAQGGQRQPCVAEPITLDRAAYNLQNTVRTHQSVRRLTPLECERLQGYEDGWTNIPPQTKVTADDLSFWRAVWDEWDDMNGKKRHTDKQIVKWLQSESADSARYKALGNSIALPPWRFVLSRIHKQGARTMASLFDGIGGFPLIWQELGGQTLWASEVEPFPIAVTKHHFKEKTS